MGDGCIIHMKMMDSEAMREETCSVSKPIMTHLLGHTSDEPLNRGRKHRVKAGGWHASKRLMPHPATCLKKWAVSMLTPMAANTMANSSSFCSSSLCTTQTTFKLSINSMNSCNSTVSDGGRHMCVQNWQKYGAMLCQDALTIAMPWCSLMLQSHKRWGHSARSALLPGDLTTSRLARKGLTRRSCSPSFFSFFTRPACRQIWAAMSLWGRPAAEKRGIFWPRAMEFMVSIVEIPVWIISSG